MPSEKFEINIIIIVVSAGLEKMTVWLPGTRRFYAWASGFP